MSPASSSALLLLFLTLSVHITFSIAVNTIGLSGRTVAADTVPSPKKVANFVLGDISPSTEKYWYSRLPNTPLPRPLGYLLQPGSLIQGPAETNPVLMNRKQGRLEVLVSQLIKSFKWLWSNSNSDTRLWKDVASSAHYCLNHSFHISMEEIKDISSAWGKNL